MHRRLVRAASTYSTEAPGHTSQHRSDRKVEAELVQTRVVLLSLKVDDLPWETGGRSGSGQFALLRPASASSSSGRRPSACISLGQSAEACETGRALHRLVTIGSLCLPGELPATPPAPSLLAPHPMSCAAELALRLLGRRGLCGRTNKNTCTAVRNSRGETQPPGSALTQVSPRNLRHSTRIPSSVATPRRSVILAVCFPSLFQRRAHGNRSR